MTIAQQLEQKGIEKGRAESLQLGEQRGIEKGRNEGKLEVARTFYFCYYKRYFRIKAPCLISRSTLNVLRDHI